VAIFAAVEATVFTLIPLLALARVVGVMRLLLLKRRLGARRMALHRGLLLLRTLDGLVSMHEFHVHGFTASISSAFLFWAFNNHFIGRFYLHFRLLC